MLEVKERSSNLRYGIDLETSFLWKYTFCSTSDFISLQQVQLIHKKFLLYYHFFLMWL